MNIYLALYERSWRIFASDNIALAWVNAQNRASIIDPLLDCEVYTGRVGVGA